MTDVLKEIINTKVLENIEAQERTSTEKMRKQGFESNYVPKGFIKAITQKKLSNKPALIAEIKKKSPSKGIIREDFNPVEIAKSYENGGATCISVLTDKKYFGGKNEYLEDVRKTTNLPILRKDFIIDQYQIYESKVLRADCILLIMTYFFKYTIGDAIELEKIAHDLGLDVLIEVHNEKELELALKMKSKLIGVNNRSLETFETSLETGKRLSKLIPDDHIKVCESGIYDNSQVREMTSAGFDAFLVGESLMRENDIETAVKALIN